MLREGNGQPVVYKVHASKVVLALLDKLYRERAEAGKGSSFLAIVRQIYHRMRHEPKTFGEPLYLLAALRLQIRQAAIAPLIVSYGVHEELPMVIVRDFKTLS